MPSTIPPLQPLQPLSALGGAQFHSLQPLVIPQGGSPLDITFQNPFIGDTGGFSPVSGPTLGGGCDPTDPTCGGGCDPSTDPFCGEGGSGPGQAPGTVVVPVINVSGNPGATNAAASSSGCNCSFFNLPCYIFCYAERIAVFVLGMAAIIGGIYMLKPGVINTPVRTVVKHGVTAVTEAGAGAAAAA